MIDSHYDQWLTREPYEDLREECLRVAKRCSKWINSHTDSSFNNDRWLMESCRDTLRMAAEYIEECES